MKKLLFLIASFCALSANAQDYLISFAGTGASTTVNTVKVENLTSGTSLTMNGSDMLHLTVLTGVSSIDNGQSSELKIYPNPMNGNTVFQVSPPVAGDAIIAIYEMTGKPVAKIHSYLENGCQEFRLSGLKSGLYLISVKGSSFQYSGKLLCNSKEAGTISVEKISKNQTVDEKKAKTDSKGVQSTVDMAYTTGDRLKLTGKSGNYFTVKIDIPTSNKTITFNFIACTDIDNNNYPVVEIGTQVWMVENLNVAHYRNGDPITNITDGTAWSNLTTEAYCDYDNSISNSAIYGKLYNFYTVVDSRNLCPAGWHVPINTEWTTLTTYLGTESIAGGKLKETGTTHWQSPNTSATNETGFTALPGGCRHQNGGFIFIGTYGYFGSSTENGTDYSWYRYMNYDSGNMYPDSFYKKFGYSVRCIKD